MSRYNGIIYQYPDLAEACHYTDIDTDNLSKLHTEFAFYLQSMYQGGSDSMTALGFKCVAQMNNWWPSHAGESRTLSLWWKRLIPENEPLKPLPIFFLDRKRWRFSYGRGTENWVRIEQHLAASGCGLKIGEPPLKATLFNKFFTLMRMPVEVTKLQETWLKKYNYRFLDRGHLASYWVNGWPPEQYSSAMEYKYFKTSIEDWRMNGMKGYRG